MEIRKKSKRIFSLKELCSQAEYNEEQNGPKLQLGSGGVSAQGYATTPLDAMDDA